MYTNPQQKQQDSCLLSPPSPSSTPKGLGVVKGEGESATEHEMLYESSMSF
jgi:hypothetical protein